MSVEWTLKNQEDFEKRAIGVFPNESGGAEIYCLMCDGKSIKTCANTVPSVSFTHDHDCPVSILGVQIR